MTRPLGRRFPNTDIARLQPGDLVDLEYRAMRVVETCEVPEVDWTGEDREAWAAIEARGLTPKPPMHVVLDAGRREHLHYRVSARSPWHGGQFHRLDPHHPVCGDCGQTWPCRDSEIDQEVAAARQTLDEVCDHCGKGGGGMQTFGGLHLDRPDQMVARFHTRKRGGCAAAAAAYEVRWRKRYRESQEQAS